MAFGDVRLARPLGGGAAATSLCLGMMTALSGCGLLGAGEHRPAAVTTGLTVSSPAFHNNGRLPVRYTCDGAAVNPPLHWSGVPSRARSIAVVVDDPDASSGAYVHWIVFDIDPENTEIAEDTIPTGARQADGTNGAAKYAPPCPPRGERHRYRFSVYALDRRLRLPDGVSLKRALATIPEHTIAQGRLKGVFGR